MRSVLVGFLGGALLSGCCHNRSGEACTPTVECDECGNEWECTSGGTDTPHWVRIPPAFADCTCLEDPDCTLE